MNEINILEVNVLVLAYLGDAIYEEYIRRYLINQKIANVNDLQTASLSYVSAKSQAALLTKLQDNNLLSEEEQNVIKRARNYKTSHHPKNCDILTYKHATALEALIGYHGLLKNEERINEIMNYILKGE